jgi:hypothetical protein
MREIITANQHPLTLALADCHRRMWDAYMAVDEKAHSEFLTADFRSVDPAGIVHTGRPTAEQIAATPIEGYRLLHMDANPIAAEAALATYTAEVEIKTGASMERFRFVVGEVWLNQSGGWKCRFYQATLLK